MPRWVDKRYTLPPGMCGGPAVKSMRSTSRGLKERSETRIAVKSNAAHGSCEACNNGWMSRLESAAALIVAPMMNGHRTVLSLNDQLVVARWAGMKALAHDADPRNDDPGVVDEAARDAIYIREVPADGLVVSIGAYQPVGRFFVTMPFQRGAGTDGEPLTSWVFAMGLGFFVVRVFAQTGNRKAAPLQLAPGGFNYGGSFSCWPPQASDVVWPPHERVQFDTERLIEWVEEPLPPKPKEGTFAHWANDLRESDQALHCSICEEEHLPREFKLPVAQGSD